MSKTAILALEDGTLFRGISIGADGQSLGEVVFNTALAGYQEALTDPASAGKMIAFTYPQIGNTGINDEDSESGKVQVAGLIIRDLPLLASNWRQQKPLDQYLRENNVVAIAEVDTRRLTRHLREKGTLKGCLVAGDQVDEAAAIAAARAFKGSEGCALAQETGTATITQWNTGSWEWGAGIKAAPEQRPYRVVVYDFGVRRNNLSALVDLGCELTVVPANTAAVEVLALKPQGIFLAGGPGDPAACVQAVKILQELLASGIPLFGLGLGHQLLALASGAKTLKLKAGHHGANHPVQNLATKTFQITSQNNDFAVDAASLPTNLVVTHKSLFDGSVQGIARTDKPAIGFQGQPEVSAGGRETHSPFSQFVELMKAAQAAS